MGNFIQQHLLKHIIHSQMYRPLNKNLPNRQNKQPITNKNNTNTQHTIPSHPKSIKKNIPTIQTTNTLQTNQMSNAEIISKALSLAIQHQDYQPCWDRFLQIVKDIFKFNLIFPSPLSKQGQLLLQNGSFIVCWLRIVSKNPYVNMNMIHKNVKEEYLTKITEERLHIQCYLNQHEQKKTPIKMISNQNLKRSMPKGSQKRVRFGKDEIIYPKLQDYDQKNRQKKASKQERKIEIRNKFGFILDYLQINDIFFLDDVEIIGVIRQFDSTYTIMQVIQKTTLKEQTCIGIITNKSVGDHSLWTIKQVEKLYQNLCFLDLDGNDPSSVWINTLPSDIQ